MTRHSYWLWLARASGQMVRALAANLAVGGRPKLIIMLTNI